MLRIIARLSNDSPHVHIYYIYINTYLSHMYIYIQVYIYIGPGQAPGGPQVGPGSGAGPAENPLFQAPPLAARPLQCGRAPSRGAARTALGHRRRRAARGGRGGGINWERDTHKD